MKKLIISLLLLSTSAFAQVTTLPTEKFIAETVLTINQVSKDILSLSVSDAGIVTVSPRLTRNLVIFKLSPTNKYEILSRIDYVSGAELLVTHHSMVCKMITDPFTLREISILNKATGEYRLVLSAQDCTQSIRTAPKDAYQLDTVKELKSKLITLALQKLNK